MLLQLRKLGKVNSLGRFACSVDRIRCLGRTVPDANWPIKGLNRICDRSVSRGAVR